MTVLMLDFHTAMPVHVWNCGIVTCLVFCCTAIPYRASTGPEQGFPCVLFLTCFHYREPLFSLQGPCIHYREFPVRKSTQGNPCSHYREWVCSVFIYSLGQGGESQTRFRQSVSAKKWLLWQQ